MENSKKIAVISQSTIGKPKEEILKNIENAIIWLGNHRYEVLGSFFEFDDPLLNIYDYKNIPLYYLGNFLKLMSKCDTIYFCNGWETLKSCRIEHRAAMEYELELIYQEIEELP